MILNDLSPQVVGITAGVFTASSLLPQFLKIIKEKKADDISIPMLLILFTGVALWIYYGTLKKDLPIILTNSFSLLLNVLTLIFRIKYSRK
jgi:MtN3 and saliva related transmembrane protein